MILWLLSMKVVQDRHFPHIFHMPFAHAHKYVTVLCGDWKNARFVWLNLPHRLPDTRYVLAYLAHLNAHIDFTCMIKHMFTLIYQLVDSLADFPRCACAVRVSVVGFVCLSVCLLAPHLTSEASVHPKINVTYTTGNEGKIWNWFVAEIQHSLRCTAICTGSHFSRTCIIYTYEHAICAYQLIHAKGLHLPENAGSLSCKYAYIHCDQLFLSEVCCPGATLPLPLGPSVGRKQRRCVRQCSQLSMVAASLLHRQLFVYVCFAHACFCLDSTPAISGRSFH